MNPSESQWTQPELSVTAYRGSRGHSTNSNNLGSHWSTDPGVAEYFQSNGLDGRSGLRSSKRITAEIPISSIETDPAILKRKGVGDTQRYEGGPINEKEITVSKGAPVSVRSISTFGPKTKTTVSKDAEAIESNIPRSVDYQQPGDSDLLEKVSKTLDRSRTRTYKKSREMKA